MLYASLTLAWLLGLIYCSIPSYWLVVHPFAEKWRARKGRIYTPLGFAWLAFIILLGLITGRWRFITVYETWWSLLPGGILFVADIYLLRKIGRDFGSDRLIGRHELNATQTDNRLITTGMHGHMRHPIYLSHLIMVTALTVASGLAVMYGLLAFGIVTGAVMIRTEDAELEKRFGDEYREYKKRVPVIGIL
jgi:protein-S-isoprenylcysteine O-methyltransferase Ste14